MVIHNPKVGGSIPPPATNSSHHFIDLHLSRDGLILLLDGPVGSRTREQVFIDCCASRCTFTSSATWDAHRVSQLSANIVVWAPEAYVFVSVTLLLCRRWSSRPCRFTIAWNL